MRTCTLYVMSEAVIPAQRATDDAQRVAVNRDAFLQAFTAKGCKTGQQRAELIGTTRKSVERYADGVVEPKVTTALRIADKLGVDVRDLWPAA